MTELTDHARSILRAIADGKIIERLLCNIWRSCNVADAGSIIEDGDELKRLRIKPETRSINGVEFAAPITGDGFELNISTGASYLDNRCFVFARSEDRNTAYRTFVDALEGKSK